MLKKIKNIIFLFLFFIFFFMILKYYFSEQNVILTSKSRSTYSWSTEENFSNLPILKNNTNNIIVYKNDIEKFKKKRKKRIWEKLISNE